MSLPIQDNALSRVDFDGAFFSGVLHVHRQEWAEAADAIDAARRAMDGRLTALMAESYSRAYPIMVNAQKLAEMEEIIEFRQLEERSRVAANHHPANRPNEIAARERLLGVWRDRLAGCRVDAEVHASILAVRSLILGPADDVEATLKLSELSRQAQRYKFAERVLLRALSELGSDLNGPVFGMGIVDGARVSSGVSNLDARSLTTLIERVLRTDLTLLTPGYGISHEQLCRRLVTEGGGLDR
jgi:hypothetical protein